MILEATAWPCLHHQHPVQLERIQHTAPLRPYYCPSSLTLLISCSFGGKWLADPFAYATVAHDECRRTSFVLARGACGTCDTSWRSDRRIFLFPAVRLLTTPPRLPRASVLPSGKFPHCRECHRGRVISQAACLGTSCGSSAGM